MHVEIELIIEREGEVGQEVVEREKECACVRARARARQYVTIYGRVSE